MSTSKQPTTPAPVTMAPATSTLMVQFKLPETFNGDRTAFKSLNDNKEDKNKEGKERKDKQDF